MEWHELVGGLGVTPIISSYFLLQIGRMDSRGFGAGIWPVTTLMRARLSARLHSPPDAFRNAK